jgi:hypothetical protein
MADEEAFRDEDARTRERRSLGRTKGHSIPIVVGHAGRLYLSSLGRIQSDGAADR